MIFGSDNQTGASSQVLEMINRANHGYTHGYGDDTWTRQARAQLQEIFECDLEVFFVTTGTAANALALSCMVQPWEKVLCHDNAHLIEDESTAPEFFTSGARLVPISHGEGKIQPLHLEHYFLAEGKLIPHNAVAGALSITQASEAGLVYCPEEIRTLSHICKTRNIKVHMDGARFANALVSKGCTPAELTWKSGIDVLSLGATKGGALMAEAVLFFDKSLSAKFHHMRKRTGHLLSKGRLLGAQFVGWLENGHWLQLAGHANRQANLFAEELSSIPGIRLAWPVEANEIFVTLPSIVAEQLWQQGAEFYQWPTAAAPCNFSTGETEILIRLVTSFLTEDAQRIEFCQAIRTGLANLP